MRGRESRPLGLLFGCAHLDHGDGGDAFGFQMLKFESPRFPGICTLEEGIKFLPGRLHGPCSSACKVVDGCFCFSLEEFNDGRNGIVHIAPIAGALFQHGRFLASTCFHPGAEHALFLGVWQGREHVV